MANEERINKLLDFPFGSFIMLRLEYLLLTKGDELEAKILRLIEKRMEDKRKQIYQDTINASAPGTLCPGQVIQIPKEIWVPISHTHFLYDLFDVVKSENTLKKAIKSLIAKKIIFIRQAQHKDRYAPAEYQLNIKLIEKEFEKMAQQGKPGYQFLIPSDVNTLETRPGYQQLPPSEDQSLIPSGYQELIPSQAQLSTTRVSEIDPHYRSNKKDSVERLEESNTSNVSAPSTEATNVAGPSLLSLIENLSLDEMELIAQRIQERRQQTTIPSEETAASSSISTPNSTIPTQQTSSSIQQSSSDSTVQETTPSSSTQETPATPSVPKQQASGKTVGKKRAGQKARSGGSTAEQEVVLTLQGLHILELYDQFKGRKMIRSPEILMAANGLGEVVRSDEDFVAVLKAIANDPFLKQKQVRTDLVYVYRKYDGFLDIVERTRGKPIPGTDTSKTDYNAVAGMTDEERVEYKRQQKEKRTRALPPGMTHEAFMKLSPDERIAALKKMREPATV